MALTPDKTRIEHGLTIREKIIPWGALWTKTVVVGKTTYYKGNKYKADRLLSGGTGKVGGVTIHNTDGGANAETYTRATYPNQNMKDCRVHYYVDDKEAWQNLLETEVGWHAGDGRGNGNETTVSIEVIMRGTAIANDDASEDNGAKLAAILLVRHGMGIEKLYKHKDWSGKQCPLYIIPHWDAFKAKVAAYMEQIKSGAGTTEPPAQELDNTPAEWEKEAVAAAISRGVIQGDTSGNLKLHSTATRAEVLVFLKRAGVL